MKFNILGLKKGTMKERLRWEWGVAKSYNGLKVEERERNTVEKGQKGKKRWGGQRKMVDTLCKERREL